MQGLDADPSSSALIDKRTDAETGLSSEQIEAVMTSLYGAGRSALASGSHALGSAAQPTFVVNISLTFSEVSTQTDTTQASSLLHLPQCSQPATSLSATLSKQGNHM